MNLMRIKHNKCRLYWMVLIQMNYCILKLAILKINNQKTNSISKWMKYDKNKGNIEPIQLINGVRQILLTFLRPHVLYRLVDVLHRSYVLLRKNSSQKMNIIIKVQINYVLLNRLKNNENKLIRCINNHKIIHASAWKRRLMHILL